MSLAYTSSVHFYFQHEWRHMNQGEGRDREKKKLDPCDEKEDRENSMQKTVVLQVI